MIYALMSLVFMMSTQSMAQNFTYDIKHHPATGNCHTIARDIATRFESATGLKAQGTCVDIKSGNFEISVSYEADKAVTPVSTFPRYNITHFASYVTEDECVAALPTWVSQFRSETGLEPVTQFCFNENPEFGGKTERKWAVRIDGFGTPARDIRTDGYLLFGAPVNYTYSSFETALRDAFERAGLAVASVRAEYRSASHELSVVYYSNSGRVNKSVTAEFFKTESCLEELAATQAVLSHTKSIPLLLVCTRGTLGPLQLVGFFNGEAPAEMLSAERMKDYSACQSQKSDLVRLYRSMGYNISGGVCTKSGRDFKVRFLLN